MPIVSVYGKNIDFGDLEGEELQTAVASAAAQLKPKPAKAEKPSKPLPTPAAAAVDGGKRGLFNLVGGAIRGAGSIGATIVAPSDMLADALLGDRERNLSSLVTGEKPMTRNEERRANIDRGLTSLLGTDPDSATYGAGKLFSEVAGTAGIGPALGAALLKTGVPAIAPLAEAVSTGGFRAGGAGIPTRIAGGSISGGASAGMVDPKNAETGAVIGGGLPVVVKVGGAVSGKVGEGVRKLAGEVSPEAKQLAEEAKRRGIDVPADRLTNSKAMNALASSLNYIPMSGRAAVEEKMAKQFEQAVAKTIGQDTDNLSQAINSARHELGAVFDDTLKNNRVMFDQQFADDLDQVLATADRTLGDDGLRVITKQVEAIKSKAATGEIDGVAAYNIKKELDRVIKSNSGQAGQAAQDLKESLLAALNRSIGPEKAEAFATARKQWGNMLDLEKAALRNSEEGGLSVARLANQKFRDPELQELAKIGRRFIKEREGQHGAAQRAFLGTGAVMASGAAAAGVPVLAGAPVAAAGTVGTARLVNALLKSEKAKNYVLNKPAANPSLLAQLLMNENVYRAAPVIGSSR